MSTEREICLHGAWMQVGSRTHALQISECNCIVLLKVGVVTFSTFTGKGRVQSTFLVDKLNVFLIFITFNFMYACVSVLGKEHENAVKCKG